MAKKLKKFDFEAARPASGAGRPPQFPWEEWFNGETYLLVQGEDFHYGRGESEPTNKRARSFLNTARSEIRDRYPDHKLVTAILNSSDEPDYDNGVNVVVKAEKMTEAEMQKREAANEKRQATRQANQVGEPEAEAADF